MGQDQLIRGHIAAESEMDAKRWRQQQQLTVVTDDVYTDIRGAFSPALQILALKSWASLCCCLYRIPLYTALFYLCRRNN